MIDTGRVAVILFVDICGSTPMYERTGDREALGLISATLDRLELIAHRHGGRVVRSKGDDLLCTFDAPADGLDAAGSMMDTASDAETSIRIGLHHGPVIEARGDIFGDAVNTAARLLDLAKPGEVLTSQTFVTMLPGPERSRLTALGGQSLKGKSNPVRLYTLVYDDGESTVFGRSDTVTERALSGSSQPVVILESGRQRWLLGCGKADLRIGRSSRCDVQIRDATVSREHATIRVMPGRVVLSDHSTSGTWICSADREVTPLKRDSATLAGEGVICFGSPPSSRHDASRVGFSVQGARSAFDESGPSTRLEGRMPRSRAVERQSVAELAVQIVREDSGGGVEARITDLSPRGAGLASARALGVPDEEVRLRLSACHELVRCVVRYANAPRPDRDAQWLHGVEFAELEPDAEAAIARILAS